MPAPKKKPDIKPKPEPQKVEYQKLELKQEATMPKEEFVDIFVPEEAGTPTLEVSINERVWRLSRGEWAHNVLKEVANVIQRSVKADRDLRRQLNRMKITPANPFGQSVKV